MSLRVPQISQRIQLAGGATRATSRAAVRALALVLTSAPFAARLEIRLIFVREAAFSTAGLVTTPTINVSATSVVPHAKSAPAPPRRTAHPVSQIRAWLRRVRQQSTQYLMDRRAPLNAPMGVTPTEQVSADLVMLPAKDVVAVPPIGTASIQHPIHLSSTRTAPQAPRVPARVACCHAVLINTLLLVVSITSVAKARMPRATLKQ